MTDIIKEILQVVFGMCLGTTGVNVTDIKLDDSALDLIFSDSYGGNTLWSYFALVGIGFSLVYFLLELNRKLAFEGNDVTMKTFIAPFLKFAGSYLVLSRGGFIVTRMAGIGNNFVDWANGYDPGWDLITEDKLNQMAELITDGLGFFVSIGLLLPCLAMMLVTIVCSLVWKFKAISYKIELLFRIGISPIALADIYSGNNSQAVRWCKAMLGTALYGASMIIVIKLGNVLAFQEMMTEWDELLALNFDDFSVWELISKVAVCVVVPIAELGAIGAVRTAIKEALA